MTEARPAARTATRRVFWAAVWLAAILVAIKASYLGIPSAFALADSKDYVRSLAAVSYLDVLFAGVMWAATRAILTGAERWQLTSRTVSIAFVAFAGLAAIYAAANVIFFGIFGGFLTYPLLAVVGDVRMVSSSVAAHLTPRVDPNALGRPVQ